MYLSEKEKQIREKPGYERNENREIRAGPLTPPQMFGLAAKCPMQYASGNLEVLI